MEGPPPTVEGFLLLLDGKDAWWTEEVNKKNNQIEILREKLVATDRLITDVIIPLARRFTTQTITLGRFPGNKEFAECTAVQISSGNTSDTILVWKDVREEIYFMSGIGPSVANPVVIAYTSFDRLCISLTNNIAWLFSPFDAAKQ